MQSRNCEVIEHKGKALVFGMEWFPILGEGLEQHARALARRQKASYWMGTSGAAASVGLARRGSLGARGRTLYSAAAAFAILHPVGTVVAIVPVSGDRQWLVAGHEGAVMARTDQLHADDETLQAVLRQLVEAHPGLRLLDGRQSTTALLDAVFEVEQDKPLSRCRHHSGRILALAAGFIGLLLWLWRAVLHSGEPVTALQPDPHSVWQAAVVDAAQRHVVHGVGGLQVLLETLKDQPVHLAGWALSRVECEPRGQRWHCHSRYRREQGGDNLSFMKSALPGWDLTFDPLEEAGAQWQVPMTPSTLQASGLRRASQNQSRLVSALQSMRPAFAQLRVDSGAPLPVATPLDAQQRPVARPPSVSLIHRRAIKLQAPLRSLSLLVPETKHMSWDKVVLEVGQAVNPGLLNSAFSVSMWGVLYELEDDANTPSDAVHGRLRARPGVSGES